MRIAFAAVLVAVLGGALPVRAVVKACALQPASGRRFIDIDVLEQGFSPFTQQAFAGDVVRWRMRAAAAQKIVPYAPTNVPGFQGEDIAPGDVVCITFGGGSVWYRDAKSQYSVVDKDSGVCHGRCASISDRSADPAPPSITPPSGPSQQKPTRLIGTSEPLTLVKIATVPPGETAYDKGNPVGQAMADETGKWKADLYIDGGSYNLVARAIDAAGRESDDSTAAGGSTVPLEVIQDTEPPTATAAQPSPPVLTWGSAISGTAADNGTVRRVVVIISDVRDGNLIAGDSGQSAVTIVNFDECKPDPCAPGTVAWSFKLQPTAKINLGKLPGQAQPTIIPIEHGLFFVKIASYDAWGNASAPVTFNVLVVRPPTVGG